MICLHTQKAQLSQPHEQYIQLEKKMVTYVRQEMSKQEILVSVSSGEDWIDFMHMNKVRGDMRYGTNVSACK